MQHWISKLRCQRSIKMNAQQSFNFFLTITFDLQFIESEISTFNNHLKKRENLKVQNDSKFTTRSFLSFTFMRQSQTPYSLLPTFFIVNSFLMTSDRCAWISRRSGVDFFYFKNFCWHSCGTAKKNYILSMEWNKELKKVECVQKRRARLVWWL